MRDSLYIAWKYVCFNKVKTATLVACITLIAFLPAALQLLLNESELQLLSRADSTPLVVGAKGSSLDLVMNSLYFTDEAPELITMQALNKVTETDLAVPIPLYVRFKARGYPIVGTTLDYFDFRIIHVAQGRMLAMLGECLVGAEVAEGLTLKPGDSLTSSPETLFDIAGVYPLKMKVVGVLERSHTSDDLAVFVDLKTAWVIQGLGHGHQDMAKVKDPTLVLKRSRSNVSATAKLEHYTEITNANLASFHFHGDLSEYPITAVIAVPKDFKSGTLLRGRYLGKDQNHQIVKPKDVVDGLLQSIFRIKSVLDAVILIVGFATVLAIVLVFALSLRLRQREMLTIFKLGCRRMTIARLVAAEILIIIAISGVLCGIMVIGVDHFANDLVRAFIIK
jgi:putative ABC transport system permease protein